MAEAKELLLWGGQQEKPRMASALDLSRLSVEDISGYTRPQREQRVEELIEESNALLSEALDIESSKRVAGIVGLFSGGNDSTVLCHLMLPRITHLAHANTTIGIEQTREYVRQTSQAWGRQLLEFKPPREEDWYRSLVLSHGFPGPGHHYKMFQRLKDRGIQEVRRTLVKKPREERVFYLAGRRRMESKRRANVVEFERIGSAVWVSPLVNWTKLDMNTYRLMAGDVPTNAVSDLLHMSGECLCGSFAHPGELEEIEQWFPEVVAEIKSLEAEIADRSDIAEERKHWGWGSAQKPSPAQKVGQMCSSCDSRWFEEDMFEGMT
jgi:3'-phosphoadenosine 5'-phosphosulfate sulfotransferase (PAPS reductase)/FAD synthetase